MPATDPMEPGDARHARYLATRSFASLDGLRGISILAVLWHHTHDMVPGWPATGLGFLGVDLFFVISGFLIVTLLLRERRRTGGISLRGFYVRRFLRIFPAYYATLVVVALIAFVKPGNTSADIVRDLPYALLYVSNLVPMHSLLMITWSLSTEEQFYLVIPTLERYARRAIPLLLPALYVLFTLPALGFFPGLRLPSFLRETTFGPILLGVMLAHLLDRPRGHALASALVGHGWAPVVASGLVLLACVPAADDLSGWPRVATHWALAALVASCVVRERHVLLPLLTAWPMRRIGVVSYGIYLYHMLVRHAVDQAMQRAGTTSRIVFFLATSLGTWALAELAYWLFESRFLALKARFAPEPSRPAAVTAPAPQSQLSSA